jgi:ATP-dependent Zn protease
MLLRTGLALGLLMAAVPSVAFSQSGSDQAQQQERACGKDVTRYCRKVVNQGDEAIQGCLQQNQKKLSRACQKVLESAGR